MFFETPAAFRSWLAKHARSQTEPVVDFHKVGSGRVNITWPESVNQALCVGWIDAVRKRIDDHSDQIRFTRRKPSSTWSAINIERVRVRNQAGRMTPEGLAAFAHRHDAKSCTYAYEQDDDVSLPPADVALFRRNRRAWAFLESEPAGYRKRFIWRIVSARQAATHDRRLAAPIDASARCARLS